MFFCGKTHNEFLIYTRSFRLFSKCTDTIERITVFVCVRTTTIKFYCRGDGFLLFISSMLSPQKWNMNRHVICIQESCQPVKQSDSCRLRAVWIANIFSLEFYYIFSILLAQTLAVRYSGSCVLLRKKVNENCICFW